MIRELLELARVYRSRKSSPQDLEILRTARLRAVIRNAYDHAPYYRSLLERAGLTSSDIHSMEDIRKLPVITKEDLRQAGLHNISAGWADLSSCATSTTNGSTGEPITVYRTKAESTVYAMLFLDALLTVGFRPRDKLCILGPYWQIDQRLYHKLGIFRREIIRATDPMEQQIQRLRDMQPDILWAYPTALRALMHCLKIPLGDLIRPRVIVTTAEVFDQVLKERVREQVDSKLAELYGCGEVGIIATQCRSSEALHVYSPYVHVECLDRGEPAIPGKLGTVVVTSLYNFAFPIIRFNLHDICCFSADTCSCTSAWPLIDPPLGRDNDLITLPSGRIISPLALQLILKKTPDVDQWRLIQETPDRFVVRLAFNKDPSAQMLEDIRSRLVDHMPESAHFQIEVGDFIVEEGLKFRSVVSQVPKPDLRRYAVSDWDESSGSGS